MHNKFTLLEVLIAAAISAVVLSILSGAAWSTLQVVEATGHRADMAMEDAALFRRLSEDLRGCRLNVYLSSEELYGLNAGEEEPPKFFAGGDDQALDVQIFTTGAITGPKSPAGIYRVYYRFDGESGELRRRQAHIAQIEPDTMPWRVIADDIETFELSFYDGEEWKSGWDSNEEGELPFSIRIVLVRLRNGMRSRSDFIVTPRIRL